MPFLTKSNLEGDLRFWRGKNFPEERGKVRGLWAVFYLRRFNPDFWRRKFQENLRCINRAFYKFIQNPKKLKFVPLQKLETIFCMLCLPMNGELLELLYC